MSGQIFQGNHLIAETNDAPLGFEQGGIEVTQAQYDQLVEDGNVAEDTNYYITDTKVIMRNNEKYGDSINGSVEALVYSKVGVENDNSPGLIRSKRSINKLVVLGNSLTGIENTYTRQNGEQFTESRELGCCRPENQWTANVYKYIKENVNSNFVMYKALCADWERDTLGSKSLTTVLDKNAFTVSETVATPTGKTLGEVLDSTVDAIIIDLYENIPMEDTESDILAVEQDFERLYRDLAERCPNAVIYQFGGFMHSKAKSTSVYRACCSSNRYVTVDNEKVYQPRPQLVYSVGYAKTCDQRLTNSGFPYDSLLCHSGDTVYDVDGNPWTTIQPSWVAHPGDAGYINIAILMLFNLFNSQSRDNEFNFSPATYATIDSPIQYAPNYSISTSQSGALYNYTSLSVYDEMFDYMQFPTGNLRCACMTWDATGETGKATFAIIRKYNVNSAVAVEKIETCSNGNPISIYASRSVGNTGALSSYNTTFRYNIDDTSSSKYTTYSSSKIDSMVGTAYDWIATATGTTDATFSNVDWSKYTEIVMVLCNANNMTLAFKSFPAIAFSQAGGIWTDFRAIHLVCETSTSYSSDVSFDGTTAASGTIHNANSNCITKLYGIY
jgi:hypothetical protein